MTQGLSTSDFRPQVVLRDNRTGQWLGFTQPCRILMASRPDEVVPALRAVDEAVRTEGLYAAGFVSYEAAPAFDPALTTRADGEFPLLWFGLYREPAVVTFPPVRAALNPPAFAWQPSVSREEYDKGFHAIREFIRNGDTYQVNFTYRLRSPTRPDPWEFFLQLAADEEPPYGAFLDCGDWMVCSASPELFFRLDGNFIESRPMKGTAARGRWFEEDRRNAADLRASGKDQAENVMIVDMVRNDLGRVAEAGSVAVASLFDVEQYPTVWQMTSTVTARTQAPLDRIFAALFPPASMTGAPKRRTMEIIAQLETSPRRVYSGAIGFVAPGRQAQFNVAIRTVLFHRKSGRAEYGVGGGIVWDSHPAREWEECAVKTRILSPRRPEFDLLETLRWTPVQGYWLLDYHLKRLHESALYFGFCLDLARVRDELERLARGLPKAPHKARLLLSRKGAVSATATPLDLRASGFADLALALSPVDSREVFLYHKTTHRRVYHDALATRPGAADVLLFNEKGEITESTIANVAVEIGRGLYTPPVRCGLLPGTLRARLLEHNKVREKILFPEDVLSAERVYLINSVRGMHRVKVISREDPGIAPPERQDGVPSSIAPPEPALPNTLPA